MTPYKPAAPSTEQEPSPSLPHTRFEVGGALPASTAKSRSAAAEPATGQILAWRDRVGHVVDLSVTREQVAGRFAGVIDRYLVDDMVFTDCHCDSVVLERTVARISTDAMRHYVFQVVIDGNAGYVDGMRRNATPRHGGILLADLGQTALMVRERARVLTCFVPRDLMESVFPDAESAHGRIVEANTPMTQLAVDHIKALRQALPHMPPPQAAIALREAVQVLVAAFRKTARLEGDARAAARSALLARARRLIDANANQPDLSPGRLLEAMHISRPTLYRLFEHEGGVQAYIRKSRLRAAAVDLVRFPHLPVVEIAYGLGFSSGSDFTRAFRRAYGMSPSDLRIQAANPQREDLLRAALRVQGPAYQHWLHRQQAGKDLSAAIGTP
ncbi:helix-turn-helix transcriptional regulator [Cupriavidus basilensis]|uniref:Helix-turn-helix transcriptional regulator n=1 Tax=Cupriavidus basilensis TaxID=68895 RepID=A0ABT6AGB2_9BURK|nr:AraC family transcriptional regulator [Cupriavidus basilensis]MDF3831644.1 helix-turn-helix transcriptional regulator [Cupriavidus basilensis]